MAMRRLTELEGAVLGLVEQHGPCTAYQVRQLFQQSPTSTWRASTGSIYPLVRRLVRLGLVKATASDRSRRSARLLSLAPAGRSALDAWVLDFPTDIADSSADPIRTRLLFVAGLPPADQVAFVDQALALTAASIRNLAAIIAALPPDEPFERFVHDGALRQLEARKLWLQDVRAALGA